VEDCARIHVVKGRRRKREGICHEEIACPRLSVEVQVKSEVDSDPVNVKPAYVRLEKTVCNDSTQVVPCPAAIVEETPPILQNILVMFVLPNARVSDVYHHAGP